MGNVVKKYLDLMDPVALKAAFDKMDAPKIVYEHRRHESIYRVKDTATGIVLEEVSESDIVESTLGPKAFMERYLEEVKKRFDAGAYDAKLGIGVSKSDHAADALTTAVAFAADEVSKAAWSSGFHEVAIDHDRANRDMPSGDTPDPSIIGSW